MVSAGTTSSFVGGFQDVMPTLAELAGAAAAVPKNIDGLSIIPTLLGQTTRQQAHECLYWTFYERGGGQAARMGDWKAVQQPYHSPLRLYNLASDLGEEHDLATQQPETAAKLAAAMQKEYTPHENWKFPAGPAPASSKKK